MPATTEPPPGGEQSGGDVINTEEDTYQLPSKCVTSHHASVTCHDNRRVPPTIEVTSTDATVVVSRRNQERRNSDEVFPAAATTRSGRSLRRNNHHLATSNNNAVRSFRFTSHRRTVSQLVEEIASRASQTTPKKPAYAVHVQRSATLDRWPRRGDASRAAVYPSYVPSYIRYSPVKHPQEGGGEDVNSGMEDLSKRTATLSLTDSRTRFTSVATCHTSPTLRRLRDRSLSDETHGSEFTTAASTVPVQTAIASMERNCTKSSSVKSSTSSMSTDSSNESAAATSTSKPVIKLTSPLGGHQQRSSGFGARSTFEPNFLRQGRITRNPRNRRSMSDPNIQKTFLEVKKLWDEKARSSAKKRGGGSNDIINRRAIGIKPVLTTPTTTAIANSASISTTTSKRPINPPPKIPPTATSTITSSHKPNSNAWNVSKTPTRRFDYDKSIEQVDREVKELEIETTRERSSVFAKAMLFGPTGRPRSPFLREKPRAESSPPAPPSTTTTTTKEHPQTPPPVDRKPAKKQLPANANSFLAASLAATAAKSAAATANNSDVTEAVDDHDAAPTNDKENRSSALEVITANKRQSVVVTSGNEGDNDTSGSDVTIPNVANEEEFVAKEADNVVALQRNASLARERRKSTGKQQQQLNSSESSENDTNKTIMDNNNKNTGADKSMTAPLRSFLHRPGSVQRRNLASSDGNNSTRSTSSTVSSAASSTYGQPDIGPLEILSGGGGGQKCENRLSGAEEMIERRLERFKRDDDSPARARPNVLEIKSSSGERSRAHTMDLGADEMVPRAQRSSSIASPRSNVSTPLSSMRPDSMSSNMSTTSGEFNLASEYDKIAQQLAEEEDQVADNGEDTVDDDDDTLKRTSKKRAVESQGDRKSVEVPSKQRAEDWTATAAAAEGVVEEDSRPPSPPLDVAVVPPTPVPPPPPEPVSLEKKLFNIAKELLSTEETYVDVLYLIDQVFHKTVVDAVAQKSIMPDAVVTGIFGHVSPIYNFHSQHLLQKLRDRISNWDTKPMIGDIMVVAAPFMKMYSLYVQQFNEAMELIKTWQQKSSAFAAIMANIHRRPECGGLTLQGHMLTPVQRIPRYELLLIDYLSRLPTDSPDYEQTTKAVALIKTAAKHSNQTIQKLEKFHKLVQIFNQLSDVNFDIVDVSRELYKEGKIIKISARSGEKHDRYLYLFSDMLLCCAQLRGITVKNYRVTAKLDLEGMHVSREVHSSSNPNSNAYNCTFCVRGLQKTMEFQASNDEEKEKWITALNSAIEEHNERKSTFLHRGSLQRDGDTSPSTHLPPHSPTIIESPGFSLSRTAAFTADLVSDAELGIRAPRWIKDHEVTMCMCCSKSFTFRRRRHHCRACGRVICSECSEHKFVLQYEQSKSQRVCTNCYKVLTGRERQEEADKKGVLEVEADEVTEHSVIADYLYFSEGEKKKNWTRMWCVIPNEQLCIYFYAAPQDVRAQLTLPLPGFAVNKLNSHDHKFAFKVSQGGKTMRFGAKDKMQMERWIYAISHASKGEDLTRAIVHNLGKPASSLPPAKHPDAVAVLPMITPATSGVGHPRVVSSSSEEEFFPNGGQSTAP